MRLTGLFLVFWLCVVALGCGSKDSNPLGALASCGFPACYLDLLGPCLPSGACVEQVTMTCGASACPTPPTTAPTAETMNVCYGNGVKMLMSFDMSNLPTTTINSTVKKGLTTCYTMTSASYAQNTAASTLMNPAGTTVATLVLDMTAQTETITCAGSSPVVVSLDCVKSYGGTSTDTGSSCTKGICNP